MNEEEYLSFLNYLDEKIEEDKIQKENENKLKLPKIIKKHVHSTGVISVFKTKNKREKVKSIRKKAQTMKENELHFFEKNKKLDELSQELKETIKRKKELTSIVEKNKKEYETIRPNLDEEEEIEPIHSSFLSNGIEKEADNFFHSKKNNKKLEEDYFKSMAKLEEVKKKYLLLNDMRNDILYERDMSKIEIENELVLDKNVQRKMEKEKEKESFISNFREKENLRILKKKKKELLKKQKELEALEMKYENEFSTFKNSTIMAREKNKNRKIEIERQFKAKKREEKRKKEEKEQKIANELRKVEEARERERNRIKGINERIAKRKKKILEDEQNEIKRIKAEGGNPYIVMRIRKNKEYEQLVERRRKQQKKKNLIRLTAQIKEEQERKQRKRKIEKIKQEKIEKWRKDISTESNLKNEKYLKKMTNKEIIDPLSKSHHLFPSKFVIGAKNWKFGTGIGSDMANENQKLFFKTMKEKYPDVSSTDSMVPKIDFSEEDKELIKEFALDESSDEESDEEEELEENDFKGFWE